MGSTVGVVFFQGLVHLASRIATFRLQFFKRYLTGHEDLVWRDVASCMSQLVDAAEPVPTDSQTLSSVLGVHSVRLT